MSEGRSDDSMVTLNIDGVTLRRGEHAVLASHHEYRNWLMPVVVQNEAGKLDVNGTAVCIGRGTFVTAKHVVDYLLDQRAEGDDGGVWVGWTKGPTPGGPANSFAGEMLAVQKYRAHPRVDLAILTTTMPEGAVDRHTAVRWSLRMPARGETVALVGYPDGTADSVSTADSPTDVVLEYPLMVGVGAVTGHQGDWGFNPKNPRSWPGFETDAPMPSAMSGGAVIDETNRLIGFASSSHEPFLPEHPDWNGYVNMLGFLLEMDVDVLLTDGTLMPIHLAELVSSGEVQCQIDHATFFVDSEGRPTYRIPTAP